MEITVTDIPKCLKSFTFSPRVILSEKTTVAFLMRMKEYIFGSSCCEAALKIGINVFDLVFIGDRCFSECCDHYLKRVRERDFDIIRTALLLKKLYNYENIRISGVMCDGDKAYVREPEPAELDLLNEDIKPKKRKVQQSSDKDSLNLNKRAKIMLESVRLAAVKYGMQNTIQYKELIDKYNYRRFSTNLKVNSRPASIEDVNAVLYANRGKCIADLSETNTRISFSALFAITYGGFHISELYGKNTVFEMTSFEREKKLSDLSSDLINIVSNGNGIEIANTFIHMIIGFTKTELPPVNMKDLASVMDSYTMYYATAALAAQCENMFRHNGQSGDLKQYLKKHTIENYWTAMDRLMKMKQYSVLVTLCYKLAHFDPMTYREDPEYQGEILYAFECAEKFGEEIKNG
ncbi:MAG: hypothetical protein J6N15_07090 [Ruminiclostridium sp.]|nr:hypothetical protein [Ruminiclostridium sp.]